MAVKVAKMPPAGVKAPYAVAWNTAAVEPINDMRWILAFISSVAVAVVVSEDCHVKENAPATIPTGPKPHDNIRVTKAVKVTPKATVTARIS